MRKLPLNRLSGRGDVSGRFMDSRVARRIKGRGAPGGTGSGPKVKAMTGRGFGMSPSILVSAVLHALVIALVMYFPAAEHKTRQVDLIAVTIASDPGPMGGGGKSPEVVEPPKKEVKETPPEKDEVKVAERKPTEKPVKEPPKPEPVREIPKAPVGPGQGPVGGGPKDAVQGPIAIEGSGGDFKYTYYILALKKKVEDNWRLRQSDIGTRSRLKAVILFYIDRGGRISGVEVEETSGYELYDQKAVLAIKKVNPMSPLPDGYDGESLGIRYTFLPLE